MSSEEELVAVQKGVPIAGSIHPEVYTTVVRTRFRNLLSFGRPPLSTHDCATWSAVLTVATLDTRGVRTTVTKVSGRH